MRILVVASALLVGAATSAVADSVVVTVSPMRKTISLPRGLGTLVLKGTHQDEQGMAEELYFSLRLAEGTHLVFQDDAAASTCHFGVDSEYHLGRECVAWLAQKDLVVRFALQWHSPTQIVLTVNDQSPPCQVTYTDPAHTVTACNLGFVPLVWGPIRMPYGMFFVYSSGMGDGKLSLRSLRDREYESIELGRGNAQSIAIGEGQVVVTWTGGYDGLHDSSEVTLWILKIGKVSGAQ